MTSKSKKPHQRIQTTGGTLSKNVGGAGVQPFKEFKFEGEVCRMTLTDPKVALNGNIFQISAATVWDIDFGKSKTFPEWLKNLHEPLPVRGWYIPASFEVQLTNYKFTFTLEQNLNKQKTDDQEFVLTQLVFSGLIPQGTLILPLPRLKVYALQLAGVFGTAYPPNFKKYFADGKSYFQTDEKGVIDIDRYGFRIPQSSAKVFTEGSNPKARLNTLENLREVARLHKTLPHGSKYADIAEALQITERLARFYVAECRKPENDLLPATGRKRSKPKKQTKGKNK